MEISRFACDEVAAANPLGKERRKGIGLCLIQHKTVWLLEKI